MPSVVKKLTAKLRRAALSLRSALILTVLVGVVVPAVLTSYQDHKRLKEQTSRQMQLDLENQGKLFAIAVRESLWLFGKVNIDAIIDAAFADTRVMSIEVLDVRGHPFTARRRPTPGSAVSMTSTTAVEREGHKIGSLILTMDGGDSLRRLDEVLEQDVRRTLQTLLGSLLLILLLLQVRLVRPIRRLVAAAGALEQGNLTDPIASGRGDELGQLARSLESTRKALFNLFAELEQRVEQRTSELKASNTALESTLRDLTATQTQLIQSEKMASLGLLVASVAHEINTPIGAVKSSGNNVADALDRILEQLPKLFELLDRHERDLFNRLINLAKHPTEGTTTREERALKRDVTRQLEALGIEDPRYEADILVQMRAHGALADILPLLRHAERDFILQTAHSIGTIINSTRNITTAVERVSKVVFALKSFSNTDRSGEMTDANLQQGIETVLTLYQNQIKQGTQLVRQYEDLPLVRCRPDELNQVWTNLIHNALQAMNHKGTLTVGIRRVGDEAIVSVGDTGSGIPEAIREKIFDAFFTTKAAGEGSGLGLDIVKKIVEQHRGRIHLQSEVGVGSTFSIYLPIAA